MLLADELSLIGYTNQASTAHKYEAQIGSEPSQRAGIVSAGQRYLGTRINMFRDALPKVLLRTPLQTEATTVQSMDRRPTK